LRIVRAEIDDVERLAALAAATFAETYDDLSHEQVADYCREVLSAERFRASALRVDTLLLLAREGSDRDLGYAQLEPTEPPAPVVGRSAVELVRLYVRREAQGRAIGGALLRAGLAWARGAGHDVCWLRVWDRNPRGVGFYEREGFRIVGSEPYRAGGMDDVVLLMARPTAVDPEEAREADRQS